MSHRRYVFFALVIQVITILLASVISIQVCETLCISQLALPLILGGMYILLRLLHYLGISMVGYFFGGVLSEYQIEVAQNLLEPGSTQTKEECQVSDSDDLMKKRMSFSILNISRNGSCSCRKKKEKKARNWKLC